MMKAWGAGGALKTHFQLSTTHLSTLFRAERKDGQTFGWCTNDVSVTIDSVTYRASEGLDNTTAHSTDDASVDTLDVSYFLDVSTEREIHGGKWDGTVLTIAEYIWSAPPVVIDDTTVNVLRYGTLGNVTCQQGMATAEIRGLTQRLSTRIGIQYGTTCPWRHALWDVGSQTYVSSAECGVDLDALGFIQSGTLTGMDMADPTRLIDTSNTQPSDYYSSGFLTIVEGDNANVTRAVRRWSNGSFYLWMPFPFELTGTEDYVAVRGDDHVSGTCQNVYNNLVHFLGFTFIPGSAAYYAIPTRI